MHNKRILVLLSPYHGSNQQLIHLAECAFPNGQICKEAIQLRSRNKLLISLVSKICQNLLCKRKNSRLAKILLNLLKPGHPKTAFDVVISKTPPYELPALIYKAQSAHTQWVHIGRTKRIPQALVDISISTPSTPCPNADVQLPVLPGSVLRRDLYASTPPVISSTCILLGGNNATHKYSDAFWKETLKFAADLAKSEKLVISTSPRTPNDISQQIKELAREHEEQITLSIWGEESQMSVGDCFYGAHSVFVTADSAGMLSEAANSGKPTFVIQEHGQKTSSLTAPLIESLRESNAIQVYSSQELSNAPLRYLTEAPNLSPTSACWSEIISREFHR